MKSGFPTYIYNNSAYLCIDADRLIISGEIDDSSEITEFAKMFGCNCVLCDVENSKFFTGDIIQRGQTMCKLCEAKKPLKSTNFPEYSQIYKTLESDFSLPCYEEFLVNLHRMLQSNSGAVIEYNDCIAILQTADKCAYISVIHTKKSSQVYRENQKSALPVVRGKASTSRMLDMPVIYMIRRSKPRPKPACLVPPKRRRSIYHE